MKVENSDLGSVSALTYKWFSSWALCVQQGGQALGQRAPPAAEFRVQQQLCRGSGVYESIGMLRLLFNSSSGTLSNVPGQLFCLLDSASWIPGMEPGRDALPVASRGTAWAGGLWYHLPGGLDVLVSSVTLPFGSNFPSHLTALRQAGRGCLIQAPYSSEAQKLLCR